MYSAYLVKYKLACIQGIKIMGQAIEKLRGFDSQLTAIHADLCLLSLSAKMFKPALKLLDVDITGIHSTEVRFLKHF